MIYISILFSILIWSVLVSLAAIASAAIYQEYITSDWYLLRLARKEKRQKWLETHQYIKRIPETKKC